mgnify:CR=1 FL=1
MAGKTKPHDEDELPDDAPNPKAKQKPATKPAPIEDDEPEPEPVKKPAHSQQLVNLALNLGFSQADIDATSSAELRQEIKLLQTEINRQPAPKAAPKKPDAAPVADEDEAFLAKLEANADIDPDYVKFMKRQMAKTKAAEEKASKVTEFEQKDAKRERERSST